MSEGSQKYDRKVKLVGYATIGVAEYWLASQDEPTVERLVLRRGKYVVEQVSKLREMSPLYEMAKEGIDLKSIAWAAH